jgi:hypothetical protein
MYKSFDLFNEFLNQNAENLSDDQLREIIYNAPAEFQGQPLYWYWQGFLAGRDSACYRGLPLFSRQLAERQQSAN